MSHPAMRHLFDTVLDGEPEQHLTDIDAAMRVGDRRRRRRATGLLLSSAAAIALIAVVALYPLHLGAPPASLAPSVSPSGSTPAPIAITSPEQLVGRWEPTVLPSRSINPAGGTQGRSPVLGWVTFTSATADTTQWVMNDGCNTSSGTYRFSPDGTVTPRSGVSTSVACSFNSHALPNAFLAARRLQIVPAHSSVPESLQLLDADGRVEAMLVSDTHNGATSAPSGSATGTVSGRLVEVGGLMTVTGERGVRGSITFVRDGYAVTFPAADDGSFSGQLPPGSYTVSGRSPQVGGGGIVCSPQQATVDVPASAPVLVMCPIR
jgi:hypothetical protein